MDKLKERGMKRKREERGRRKKGENFFFTSIRDTLNTRILTSAQPITQYSIRKRRSKIMG